MQDRERISVVSLTLPTSTAALVAEACAMAGLTAKPFDGVTPLPTPASLVIAELRAGDRRVPQRVLDAVALSGGQARLLLLCAETLVRPHVTTQRGRVVMVSPPHSASRLSSRIRVLLADLHSKPDVGPLKRREHYSDRWWLCSFESRGTELGVLVQPTDAVGMTAVLFPPGGGPRDELLGRVIELLARERGEEARRAGLAQVAGSCAVVHLSAAGDRWLFHWPSPTWPLRIHSPQRLPPRADIAARASDQQAWSMPATSGDLVLACSGSPVAADGAPIDLWPALEEGGPAAVDLLDESTELAGAVQGGVAVEVH